MNGVFLTTIQGASFQNCNFGVDMGQSGKAGMVSLVDSSVQACNAGVNAAVTNGAQNSLVIDGFSVGGGAAAVKAADGSTLLQGSVPAGQTWVLGNL
jgi:glucan 1,3-beta-glucosidase